MVPAVEVRDLDVVLRRERHTTRSLRDYMVRRIRGERTYGREAVRVLTGVSLSVEPGSVLGVIGANGAGKTTLLRVLAGIVPPAAGEVVVRGRIAPLIELGAGFDPELTGVENIMLYGTLLGATIAELRRATGSIAEFAGLRPMLDVSVRQYSTGMIARLGFSIAMSVHPSVLLIDEAFAVGDEAFRARCVARIRDLRAAGCAVVLVSHDLDLVRREADQCVLLHGGAVAARGSPGDVASRYAGGASA